MLWAEPGRPHCPALRMFFHDIKGGLQQVIIRDKSEIEQNQVNTDRARNKF
jgi:hypothetical protein